MIKRNYRLTELWYLHILDTPVSNGKAQPLASELTSKHGGVRADASEFLSQSDTVLTPLGRAPEHMTTRAPGQPSMQQE